MNRFAKQNSSVKLDSNFLFEMNGRPITLHKQLTDLLHISINNDSLCLDKSKRVDYSLLAVINNKDKWIRFGIIDYLQVYTPLRVLESNFKKAINLGTRPTIIDPRAYRLRFSSFM